jgi:hypothetical protein
MQQHGSHFRDGIRSRRVNAAQTAVDVETEVQFLHVCRFEVRFLGEGKERAETGRECQHEVPYDGKKRDIGMAWDLLERSRY